MNSFIRTLTINFMSLHLFVTGEYTPGIKVRQTANPGVAPESSTFTIEYVKVLDDDELAEIDITDFIFLDIYLKQPRNDANNDAHYSSILDMLSDACADQLDSERF